MGEKKIIRNRIPLLLAFFWTLIIMGSSLYSFSKINSNKNFESNILSLIPDQVFPSEDPLLCSSRMRSSGCRGVRFSKRIFLLASSGGW